MKIILDESTPHKLRLLIGSRHTVVTTWFQGWSGLKNGELLAVADEAGFDLFVTSDQKLGYQQNLAERRMEVLVLSTNNWSVIRERAPQISAAIDASEPSGFVFLDIGHGRGA